VNREVVVDLGRQHRKVVLREAELAGVFTDAVDVHPTGLTRHVDVPARVLAEGRGEVECETRRRVSLHVRDLERVRVDDRAAVVAVHVPAEEARNILVAHDVAARDRAP
jgi:hypothetical protein